MALMAPIMHFLRPLGPPRPATVRHFLRYSTAPVKRAQQPAKERITRVPQNPREDRNLAASRTASPTYPPPSMASKPRPKESRASRRTSLPPKKRSYPTRQPSHSQPEVQKLILEPVQPLPAEQCAPNLPYFVTRTTGQELPIYHERKRAGGSLLRTQVKKIDGSIETLRDELRTLLGLHKDDCVINPVTKHIVLKGHHKPRIQQHLRERLF